MEHEKVSLDETVRVFAAARPSVVVAEDDEDLARAVAIMLATDFDVAVYGSARELVAALEVEIPDLLLLDYQLPDINGVRLVETLRRRAGNEFPAIMMSAYSNRRDAAQKAGFHLFLQKPFGRSELLGAVNAALGR
jgi:DNA-binding response OmpR family regulator